MKKTTAQPAAPSNKEVLNDEYKIDTYGVKQYEEKRVVSKVTLLEPKGRNKYVLCHVESLMADCLVPVKDLLPINEDKEVLNITKGEWCINEEENTVSKYRIYTAADGSNIGWFDPDEEQAEQGLDNSKAIVTDVNETYGKGYNPAAMDELYKALKATYDLAEEMGMIMTSKQWTEKFRNKFNPIMTATETALNNAKTIKP